MHGGELRGDCGERDARRGIKRGLWGKGCEEGDEKGTVGKGMHGGELKGDCGERDVRRGIKRGTVGKGM